MVEIPAKVARTKRIIVKRELENICYYQPKRNVYLLEAKEEKTIKKIKEFVLSISGSNSKVHYYQLVG